MKRHGGGEQAGEKGLGGVEMRQKLRVLVWLGKQVMQVARAQLFRTGKLSGFATPTSRASGTVQTALGVGGRGREIFSSATCSLQFAKANAATPPQQKKNDSADL
jgi:hypothetical protein